MIYNSNNYRNAKRILSHYGRETQERQLIEEMAELTKALNKKWRFDNGFIDGKAKEFNDNIAEEMADVIIGIEQMIIAYNCRHKILETIDSKVKRTIERIDRRRRI